MEHVRTRLRAQLVFLRLRHYADTVRDTVEKVRRQVFLGRRHAHKLGVRVPGAVVGQLRHTVPDHHTLHPGSRRSEYTLIIRVTDYASRANATDTDFKGTLRTFCRPVL